MAELRHAVLIGCSEFPNSPEDLAKLRCPENDVDGMLEILTARPWGMFQEQQTHVLKNQPHDEILFKIEEVLNRATRDDMVLIYYSGHGRCDDHGWLYLAAANTDTRHLGSTSIPAQLIKSYIDNGAATKVVLILDCCFSGAVGKVFFRGGGVDNELRHIADGRGTFILTASTKLQTAREREGDRYGLLTKHIIYGVQEREADANGDGLVSMHELYKYVHQRVKDEGPQEPQLIVAEARGEDLALARTGILPRKERERKLKELLFDLNKRSILSHEIMMRAMGIVSQTNTELFGENRRYDELLDRLLHQQVEVGEFYTQWYRIGSAAPAFHTPTVAGPSETVQQTAGTGTPFACVLARTLPKNPRGVLSLAFSPGGSYLATGGGDGKAQIWEVGTGALVKEFVGPEGPVWTVAFTPDGRRVTSAGADGIVRVWDFASGALLSVLSGHHRPVVSVAVSPRGDLIASGSYDGSVKIWDVERGNLKRSLSSGSAAVNAVAFHLDGELVAAAGAGREIRLWDVHTGQLSRTLPDHRGDVHAIAFSAGGRYFASGGKDTTVKFWETSQWVLKRSFRGEPHPVLSVAFSNDERLLASGSSDGVIRIWDTDNCELVRSVEAGHISVHAVAFSPDNRLIASAGADETVRLWNWGRAVHRRVPVR